MCISSHVKEEKIQYYHSKHQQLWILMSNPAIVMEFLYKSGRGNISDYKEYVLSKYMGIHESLFPKFGCYPCDCAETAAFARDHHFERRCEMCPLKWMDNCGRLSDYAYANSTLHFAYHLMCLYDYGYAKEINREIFKFCTYAQKIAFKPLNKEVVEEYYEVV